MKINDLMRIRVRIGIIYSLYIHMYFSICICISCTFIAFIIEIGLISFCLWPRNDT